MVYKTDMKWIKVEHYLSIQEIGDHQWSNLESEVELSTISPLRIFLLAFMSKWEKSGEEDGRANLSNTQETGRSTDTAQAPFSIKWLQDSSW